MTVAKIAAGVMVGILGAVAVLYIVSQPITSTTKTAEWRQGYVATIQRPLTDKGSGERLEAGLMLDAEVSADGGAGPGGLPRRKDQRAGGCG